ncbi:hypothetical protein [Pseudomonas sp. SDI]|uniref:hypothetical protein n=1 Tax=Pseudomonas sp. SDI TaxID=2170734 RepID=UPI002683B8E0
MSKRIEWAKQAPKAYKAMAGLELAVGKSGLESSLLELACRRCPVRARAKRQ